MRRQGGAAFELVLLDPPFEADLFAAAIEAAARLVVADGYIYLEADRRFDEPGLAAHGLALHRHLKAGQVHAHLLRRWPDPVGA
jgi:16S rRNA G966 N2-methylase RsmD